MKYFIAGILAVSLPLLFFYPRTFQYSLIAHPSATPATIPEVLHHTITSIISGGELWHTIFLGTVLLILCIYSYRYNKKFLPLILLIATIIPLQFIGAMDGGGKAIQDFPLFEYHLIPYILLLIAGILIIARKIPQTRTIIFAVIIWMCIFAPQSTNAYYPWQTIPEQTLYDEFLNTLDYSQAYVDHRIEERITKKIQYINYNDKMVPPEQWETADTTHGTGIKKLGLYNPEKNKIIYNFNEKTQREKITQIYQVLINNDFKLVVILPEVVSPTNTLLLSPKPRPELLKYYTTRCTVLAPLLFEKKDLLGTALIYVSDEDCMSTKEKMQEFYLAKMPEMCSRYGKKVFQRTSTILSANKIETSTTCEKEVNHYSLAKYNIAIIILLLIFVLWIFYKKEVKKRN